MQIGWYSPSKRWGIPSLFDCLVILFILILPVIGRLGPILRYNSQGITGLYLVFGSLAIVVCSLSMAQIRVFKSLSLTLLTLWAMLNIWINSWIPGGGIIEDYLNWCYLNEGFIYILVGALLITSIVKYAKSYGWYYLALMIVITRWYLTFVIPTQSNSPLMALFVVFPILLFKKKQWLLALLFITLIVVFISMPIKGSPFNYWWEWLAYKWRLRPIMLRMMLPQITWKGLGFPHDLASIYGWFYNPGPPGTDGWAYIQNDYVEYARAHGWVGLGLGLWFLKDLFWGKRISIIYGLGLGVAILCAVQRTIFFPFQGGIILIIAALLILENEQAKSFSLKE